MWLRLYTELLNDPKAQRLPGEQFKGWINLLCLAKENDGLIPSIEDIAFQLRITEAEAQSLVEVLARRGLLDQAEDGLTPHNWDTRQFISDEDPTAAIRARRYRQNKSSVTDTVTRDVADASHPSEAETEQSRTDTEQSREPSRAPRRSASRRPQVCDDEYLAELQANPAYAMLDVRRLYHKMVEWCRLKGKQPTRGRLVNWLNREDVPFQASKNGAKPKQVGAPLPAKEQPADDYMAESVEELIAANDFESIGQIYDAIVRRGGAKAEWEIRCVAYYELHKDEPATPEQVATLKASIDALAKR